MYFLKFCDCKGNIPHKLDSETETVTSFVRMIFLFNDAFNTFLLTVAAALTTL